MKRKQAFAAIGIMILLLGSVVVDVSTLLRDWSEHSLELFELIARALGYGMSIAALVLCGMAVRRSGDMAAHAWRSAFRVSMACVVLLCVHDVLLYLDFGNVLEGVFTMTAYFAMDAALVLLYAFAAVWLTRSPSKPLPRALCLGLLAVWLLYIVGDMAGYPASSLQDWDEALMKLDLAVPVALPLLLGGKHVVISDRSDTRS